ncbi:hypothetical protein BCF46_0674 [Litoreibacter meonggei]|uniref:DUF2946 family protein n=1 Tax=Litoreibacter meonggei TaxID=1049199 RepID=A0A497X6G2_9RHOB|nr:hypothetical protein [Litoreibacter meonggei]RLJ60473.1 hypothetical protein BCF46_0674 [Litoreibacter meonggei]
MIHIRRLFAAFLVLTMVATTGSMAVMRDRDAGTPAMVICNGSGLQTILLNAHGDPVDPAPICPDCTMVMLADGPPPVMVLRGDAQKMDLVLAQASQSYVQTSKGALNARAPPVG